MLSERNRLALELHDAVSQKLFSARAHRRGGGDGARRGRRRGGGRARRRGWASSAREALEELRSLILELRPPELERDGLCGALRKHVEVLRRLHRVDDRARRRRRRGARRRRRPGRAADRAGGARQRGPPRGRATRAACGSRAATATVVLEVADDGAGFEPADPEVRAPPARADVDGGARGAARRAAGDPQRARAPGRRVRLEASIRVLIVDDHAVVREGLRTFLSLQDGIEVAGEAGDGARRRRARRERLRPDVILMDLVMPRLDGVGRDARAAPPAAGRARDRAHALRRRRAAAARDPGGRGGLPAQERRAGRARAGGARRARRRGAARPGGRRAAASARSPRPAGRRRRPSASPAASRRCSS